MKSILVESISSNELVSNPRSTPPSFKEESNIDVQLENGLLLNYPILNFPSEAHRYCLGMMKEESRRGGSDAMHNLQDGAKIEISPSRNNFEQETEARNSALMAGVIEINPILSTAQAFHDHCSDFVLHYCASNESRIALQDVLIDRGHISPSQTSGQTKPNQ